MNILIPTYITIIGLIVGSYLNVAIYRLPLNKSTRKPRSHCPKCKHQLKPWENIPLFSWIFLKAKCSQCKQPISFRYPAIEAVTGLGFLGIYLSVGLNWILIPLFWTFAVSLVALMVNVDRNRVSNKMLFKSWSTQFLLLVGTALITQETKTLLICLIPTVILLFTWATISGSTVPRKARIMNYINTLGLLVLPVSTITNNYISLDINIDALNSILITFGTFSILIATWATILISISRKLDPNPIFTSLINYLIAGTWTLFIMIGVEQQAIMV